MSTLYTKDYEEQKFNRRLFLIGGIQAIGSLSLLSRLVYLGIIKGKNYQILADKNRIKLQYLIAKRGEITDRYNRLIASNEYDYYIYITPEKCDSTTDTLRQLQYILQFDDDHYHELLKELSYYPKFIPQQVAGPLTWSQVCKLEIHRNWIKGCDIEKIWIRKYPYNEAFAHVLGYVQIPNQSETNLKEFSARLPGYRIGKVGLEKTYESKLQGIIGLKKIEVNAHNRLIRDLENMPSKSGQLFKTTLNAEPQIYVSQQLSQFDSAAAVVLNIDNGHVLALHSHPSFDPNLLVSGISGSQWKSLIDNERRPLHNKAVQGLYPPGSVFKTLVGLAAFHSKLVPINFSVICKGYIELGHHRFHCWHRHGHGYVDINQALKQSCDIYFYEIAKIIGMQRIIECAYQFGLGQLTGIELIGENKGFVPSREWKKSVRKSAWTLGDTIQIGIGQGDLLVTPLQLSTLIASLINSEQRIVKPTLNFNHSPSDHQKLPFSPEHLDIIKKGLDDTVNKPDGLCYRHRIAQPGFELGGKTSTAQVRRITMEERRRGVLTNEQRPWTHRDHAIFAFYAPIHQPKYAGAVIIEHGGSGGKVAAPIGRDLALMVQKLENHR